MNDRCGKRVIGDCDVRASRTAESPEADVDEALASLSDIDDYVVTVKVGVQRRLAGPCEWMLGGEQARKAVLKQRL